MATALRPERESSAKVAMRSTESGEVSPPGSAEFGVRIPSVPILAAGRPVAVRICRANSTVEVFPLVPVTRAAIGGRAP